MKTESALMGFFRRIGLPRIAWSLRRWHCPVRPDALVLEVGSGGNPYFRANVLIDAYMETRERHWVPLKADRPAVIGFGERLPFQDKAFDFVIASHVLEHSPHPERFLAELARVAKAGYIEVPDAFLERINPYQDHRLEITERDGMLVIRKKGGWIADRDLVGLYEHRIKGPLTGKFLPRFPFEFHVRYYWTGSIRHTVVNPEQDADWIPVRNDRPAAAGSVKRPAAAVKEFLLNLARSLFSQTARNRKIDLTSLLQCVRCGAGEWERDDRRLVCKACRTEYAVKDGIPHVF